MNPNLYKLSIPSNQIVSIKKVTDTIHSPTVRLAKKLPPPPRHRTSVQRANRLDHLYGDTRSQWLIYFCCLIKNTLK